MAAVHFATMSREPYTTQKGNHNFKINLCIDDLVYVRFEVVRTFFYVFVSVFLR